MSSPKIFTAHLREMTERFDPRYVAFCRRTAKFRYPMVRLGDLLSALPEYGAGEAGIERTDIKQPRYIRITDITDDGELSQEIGATAETIEAKYFLSDGDLLFARSGATVGKCYLHEASKIEYPCFYAGYMIRFRFKATVLPKYVFGFAQTAYYRDWVAAIQRSAGQPNINALEYCNLPIPLPPRDVQARIVAELDAAYAAKRKADAKAAELLASIDNIVLDALGIPPLPPPDTSLSARIFTISSQDTENNRLDAHHYEPYFRLNLERVQKIRCQPLKYLVELSHDIWEQEKWNDGNDGCFPYLEIGAISTEDGSILHVSTIPIAEAPSRARMIANRGDLLVSLTRPTRGAIAFVPAAFDRLVASTGFAIIRKTKPSISKNYLFEILRTELCTLQFDQRSSGGNYPAITEDQLLKCKIPVPPISVQQEIVDEVSAIRTEVRRVKSCTDKALSVAKRKIENELIHRSVEV